MTQKIINFSMKEQFLSNLKKYLPMWYKIKYSDLNLKEVVIYDPPR
jgi:hypothetical protein